MKNVLKRNNNAVDERVSLKIRFSLPVTCKTARAKPVSVPG
jgi:hypothetical protein